MIIISYSASIHSYPHQWAEPGFGCFGWMLLPPRLTETSQFAPGHQGTRGLFNTDGGSRCAFNPLHLSSERRGRYLVRPVGVHQLQVVPERLRGIPSRHYSSHSRRLCLGITQTGEYVDYLLVGTCTCTLFY